MKLVIFGLTISSSWGNGHATLWRGLCRALGRRGARIVFFERDVPYYAAHRDLDELPGGRLELYSSWDSARSNVRSSRLRHSAHQRLLGRLSELLYTGQRDFAGAHAKDVLGALALSDYELETIARRARARALEEHSAECRARDFEEVLADTTASATEAPRYASAGDPGE